MASIPARPEVLRVGLECSWKVQCMASRKLWLWDLPFDPAVLFFAAWIDGFTSG